MKGVYIFGLVSLVTATAFFGDEKKKSLLYVSTRTDFEVALDEYTQASSKYLDAKCVFFNEYLASIEPSKSGKTSSALVEEFFEFMGRAVTGRTDDKKDAKILSKMDNTFTKMVRSVLRASFDASDAEERLEEACLKLPVPIDVRMYEKELSVQDYMSSFATLASLLRDKDAAKAKEVRKRMTDAEVYGTLLRIVDGSAPGGDAHSGFAMLRPFTKPASPLMRHACNGYHTWYIPLIRHCYCYYCRRH